MRYIYAIYINSSIRQNSVIILQSKMKEIKSTIIIFALIIVAFSQNQLVVTSNDKIEVQPLKSLEQLAALEAVPQTDNQTSSLTPNTVLPLQLPSNKSTLTPNSSIFPEISKKIIYAQISEPSIQVRMINARNQRLRSYFNKNLNATATPLSSQAEKSLNFAKWIFGGQLGTENLAYYTPCSFNSCPKSQFTFYIQATCDFIVQLIDENNKSVSTIGNGAGWLFYGFKFNTVCGKYRIKVILNCRCPQCSYTRFNLLQDRKDCFNCSNNFAHSYNTATCSCQCANNFACKSTQKWLGFPDCTCGCKKQTICKAGEYFNRKQCACKPLLSVC